MVCIKSIPTPIVIAYIAQTENRRSVDISTLTDVCSSDDLAEVEIVSLLEESIPKYTLR